MTSAFVFKTADRRNYRAFCVSQNGPELLCCFTHLKQYTLQHSSAVTRGVKGLAGSQCLHGGEQISHGSGDTPCPNR